MKTRKSLFRLFLLAAVLTLVASFASAATQTLTGLLTDDMCGKKHTMMPGKTDSECVRACVKSGSNYALLVGDKLYLLKGDTNRFDQLAGKKVKVSGDVNGSALSVSSITEEK